MKESVVIEFLKQVEKYLVITDDDIDLCVWYTEIPKGLAASQELCGKDLR